MKANKITKQIISINHFENKTIIILTNRTIQVKTRNRYKATINRNLKSYNKKKKSADLKKADLPDRR